MNKAEIIKRISEESGLSEKDAKKALDSLFSSISKELKRGGKIKIIGFGSFSISRRSARTGRNPQTGKALKIGAKDVVRFKASDKILETGDNGPRRKE